MHTESMVVADNSPGGRPAWSRRLLKLVLTLGVLTGLYALIGFAVLPPLLKPWLVRQAEAYTHQPLALAELSLNPFALSVRIRGLSLGEQDSPLLRFEEIYANFQAASLFNRAYTFAQIRLTGPRADIRILPDGRLNLKDLLPSPRSPQPESTSDSAALPPILIHALRLDRGEVSFEDRSLPTPFQTRLPSFSLALDNLTTRTDSNGTYLLEAAGALGETLRLQGDLSLAPLRLSGNVLVRNLKASTLWSYLQDRLNFVVQEGTMEVAADFTLAPSGADKVFQFRKAGLKLAGLRLLDRESREEVAAAAGLEVSGATVDLFGRRLRIADVKAHSIQVRAVLDPAGKLDLAETFRLRGPSAASHGTGSPALTAPGTAEAGKAVTGQPDSGAATAGAVTPGEVAPGTSAPDAVAAGTTAPDLPASRTAAPGQPSPPGKTTFPLVVEQIEIRDCGLSLEDRQTEPPARLRVSATHATVQNLSPGTAEAARVDLDLTLNDAGQVSLTGTFTPRPLALALRVQADGVALLPFQPYLSRYANLELRRGSLSLDGNTSIALGEQEPGIAFTGNLTLKDLRARDTVLQKDFTRWQSLAVNGIAYEHQARTLGVTAIVAEQPFVRFLVDPDRTTNLKHILVPPAPGPGPAPQNARPLQVRIGEVRVANGSLRFADLSLQPNFAASIHELTGTIRGLSSQQLSRADVELRGNVDKYAPVTINGQINPLSTETFTNIRMHFEGIEFNTFTPYSGKFAGYKIEKGKLNLDLRYQLSQNTLVGENRVVINQLELGQRVESPDATSLPVRLAIALLKDSRGVIDVDIPVRGDLNDPEFRFGSLIGRALLNLVAKIATSPFRALSGLAGGAEEQLSYVVFQPGESTLAGAEQEKLTRLAAALAERPGLRLEIRGSAAPTEDRRILAELALRERLAGQEGGAPRTAKAAPATPERLLDLYREVFHQDPEALLAPVPEQGRKAAAAIDPRLVQAAHERLLTAMDVTEEDLRELARARADAIRDFLVARAGMQVERIFLLDIDTQARAEGGEIRATLSLEA